MKKITTILFTLWMAGTALADQANWLTSLPDATQQARRENKLILLDFTGSDWCGWCKKLDADTLSQPQFIDYAKQNLVLVQLDFPKNIPQSDDLKAANNGLKQQYAVQGFPTLVVVTPDGKTLWKQTGYSAGGPPALINQINQSLKSAGLSVPAAPPSAPAPVVVAPGQTAPYLITADQQYVAPKRNPGAEPKLQAILYSAAHSAVVLDGESCEEGETVHGMHILKIARNEVTVEFNGQEKLLSLK